MVDTTQIVNAKQLSSQNARRILAGVFPHIVDLASYFEQLDQLIHLLQLPNEEEMKQQLDQAAQAIRDALTALENATSQEERDTAIQELNNAMALYEELLAQAFGLTIDSAYSGMSLVNAAQSLLSYGEGSETVADLFASLYADYPDFFAAFGLGDFNRYAYFQAVMGPIGIVQTYAPPQFDAVTWACVESEPDPNNPEQNRCLAWRVARGYTRGHTIYDIWAYSYEPPEDVSEREPGGTYVGEYSSPMTSDNFAHELMHSFLSSSAFGNHQASVLGSLVEFMREELKRAGDKAVHEGDWSEPVEIIADYLTTLAHGNVNADSYGEQLKTAMTNAMLYNHPMEIETVADALGITGQPVSSSANQTIAITGAPTTNIRDNPNSNAQYASLPVGTSLDILGRTSTKIEGYYWIYVRAQYQGRSVYGWIRADLIALNGEELSSEFIESLGTYR